MKLMLGKDRTTKRIWVDFACKKAHKSLIQNKVDDVRNHADEFRC